MIQKIVTGDSYSYCSVIAAAKKNQCVNTNNFQVHLQLEGWKEEVVMEVIHKQFSHSPNKVLALKLKLSSNEPFKHLLRCPLLAQLGNKEHQN